MAWTSLTYAYGSVLTSAKMTQLYDNITAQANGDSGAPKQQTAGIADNSVTSDKLPDYTAGYYGNVTSDLVKAVRATNAKVAEYKVSRAGTLRTIFSIYANTGTTYGRVYVNGVATGTNRSTTLTTPQYYTDDITVAKGDLVQLYSYNTANDGVAGIFGVAFEEFMDFAVNITMHD